jgi:hypothetical protein
MASMSEKEASMAERTTQLRTKWIYRYLIGCADMYYEEIQQRDVFVRDDPDRGFQIWGQIVHAGPATSVGVCEMFLEYALYCRSWCNVDEAIYHISNFGEKIGCALAKFIQETPPAEMNQSPGICTLMCLWESMNIQFTIEQVGPEMHFLFANCPLEEAARRNGLHEVELALHGVNALCQTLIHHLDPQLEILTPLETRPDFVFSVRESIA